MTSFVAFDGRTLGIQKCADHILARPAMRKQLKPCPGLILASQPILVLILPWG
jgi:hypothetical protein